MNEEIEIKPFTWWKMNHYCRKCGRGIGSWASKHSGLCLSCLRKQVNKKIDRDRTKKHE